MILKSKEKEKNDSGLAVIWQPGGRDGAPKNISSHTGKVTISGALKSVSRQAELQVLREGIDRYLGATIRRGDAISAVDAGETVYRGLVWETEVDTAGFVQTLICFDKLKFLLKSRVIEGSYVDKTAKEITEAVCKECGVSFGSAPDVGGKLKLNARGKTGYDVLLLAWTEVRKKTGKPYYFVLEDEKLAVIEKGKALEGKCLVHRTEPLPCTLTSVRVHESSEDAVTALVYTDEMGKKVDLKLHKEFIKLYGYIQQVREKKVSKDAPEINGGKVEISAEALGDWAVRTGYAIDLKCSLFKALLYIEGDTHIYEKGVHTMSLDLSYDNIMDEAEGGGDGEKGSGASDGEGSFHMEEDVTGQPEERTLFGYCPCAICASLVSGTDGAKPFHTAAAQNLKSVYVPSLKDWPNGGNFVVEGKTKGSTDAIGIFFETHDDVVQFGQRRVTVYPDGKRTLRKVVDTSASGAIGEPGDGIARGRYIDPTRGAGVRTQGAHYHGNAIDIGAPVGTPIVAADGGVVAYAGWMGSYGNVVFINHGAGSQTRYAHLSRIHVAQGQQVSQGQQVGACGNTGHSFGAHLHFEICHKGVWTYPGPIIGR